MTTHVPAHKLKQFQEILGACFGRFDYNPIHNRFKNNYYVSVTFDNPENGSEFGKRWAVVNCDVVEKIRKPTIISRLKKLLRK
jgi:hypothetical protein